MDSRCRYELDGMAGNFKGFLNPFNIAFNKLAASLINDRSLNKIILLPENI